jgi:predicted trehalose synthase
MSSNTAVTLNETLFLKGYRHVRQGINPELEMGRFLTEVAVPQLRAGAGRAGVHRQRRRTMTLAMVQSYVANQGDGWDYTLGYLERFLRDVATTDGATTAPDVLAVHGGFLALMATLGRRTGELHRALATRTGAAAFDPEPLRPPTWRATARTPPPTPPPRWRCCASASTCCPPGRRPTPTRCWPPPTRCTPTSPSAASWARAAAARH